MGTVLLFKMSSPIEDVASLRQKLTDVESQVLDMQVEVDGRAKTEIRLRKTIDEQKEKISALQTQPEAAGPPDERFLKLQADLETEKEQKRRLEVLNSNLQARLAGSQASCKDLESKLGALRERTHMIIEKHNKLVDEASKFTSETQSAYLRWATYQTQKGLELIVDEPPEADRPQDSVRLVGESRPTSQPQDLVIDTKSSTQEPEKIDTSRKRKRSPAGSSIIGRVELPASGDFLGQSTCSKGDESRESLGRGRVPLMDSISSSLRRSHLPARNTVKAPGQAVSNKADVVKSANPSYSSMVLGPKPVASPAYAAFMPKISELSPYELKLRQMTMKQQEEMKEGGWDHVSDSDSEPTKTSPPASNAPLVTDQSATTQVRESKPPTMGIGHQRPPRAAYNKAVVKSPPPP